MDREGAALIRRSKRGRKPTAAEMKANDERCGAVVAADEAARHKARAAIRAYLREAGFDGPLPV